MSSLAAFEFNKLHQAGMLPPTYHTQVSIERKRSELNGSLDLSQWGASDDAQERASADAARKLLSTERKQEELRGSTKLLSSEVVFRDAFRTHAQVLEPERNFEVEPPPHWADGKIVHVKEPRPSSPINGSPKLFRKGTGDRTSHIDCLPLTNSPPVNHRERLPEVRGSSPVSSPGQTRRPVAVSF
eukprot:TRINITY_DN4095_c0_g2_i1.p1 TRINITY_DN4095_c0_g2~~TRINITY_DN4095_c0_g2_i1.p1  ORF type:complete len:186 (-),score=35.05 TRINITY_DN4095_c0_g2_i1:380-937(-)